MKTLFLALLLIISSVGLNGQELGTHSKHDCEVMNLTLDRIDSTNSLYDFMLEESISGVINLHPFTIEDIGGWENFLSNIRVDSNITFAHKLSTPSRLLDGTFHQYKQLYKGIEVIDGGFTILTNNNDIQAVPGPSCPSCPPVEPCAEIQMFSPFIYEDINLSVIPTLSESQLAQTLNVSASEINNIELKVVNNILKNCEYLLVYKTIYQSEVDDDMVGWVDAHSGNLLYESHLHNHKNAPTADFGIQFMNDQQIGNNTLLRKQGLRCYDMTGNFDGTGLPIDYMFNNVDIPISPINEDWSDIHADPEVFQLFWMTEQIIDVFDDRFGIEFVNVRVGFHPGYHNAKSFRYGLPHDLADFTFGVIAGSGSYVEFDVIAHELGHAIIRQFISSDLNEGASLHEGLSDVFGAYVESILQPNGIDWIMGDDIPHPNGRDMQNTTNNCFTDIQNNSVPHTRGEALGHWFFLCVTGSPANSIQPMNIDEIMALIVDAMPNVGDNADYPDLMKAIINLAIAVHGPCSDQVRTIVRAWETICVPTGHRFATPNVACAHISGNSYFCEEFNQINLCVSSAPGLNSNYGRWTIIGRNSAYFTSVLGMQGNQQFGGMCLDIFVIPDMRYYPQTMTIQYWHPDIGEVISKKIVINDCDNDDLTCHEYYNTSGSIVAGDKEPNVPAYYEIFHTEALQKMHNTGLKLKVYDMMGNVIVTSENSPISGYNIPQVLIYTFWDDRGRLVKTRKVFARQ